MCSVTIHRNGQGLIITMNRDESLARPPELPPYLWQNTAIIAPLDPESQGTWIGAREDGFWACLLNGYLKETDQNITNPESRGRIIPEILSEKNPLDAVKTLNLSNTRSLRLLIGNNREVTEHFWDTRTLTSKNLSFKDWYFVTSSSLSQDAISLYRHEAFDDWVGNGAETQSNGIPEIHLYQEPCRAELGVMMQRDYAKTKSITQIIVPHNQPPLLHYWNVEKLDVPPIRTSWKTAA